MFRCSSRAQALSKATSSRARKQGNHARFVFELLVIQPNSNSPLRKTFCLSFQRSVQHQEFFPKERNSNERRSVLSLRRLCVFFLNWLLYSKGLVNKMYKALKHNHYILLWFADWRYVAKEDKSKT